MHTAAPLALWPHVTPCPCQTFVRAGVRMLSLLIARDLSQLASTKTSAVRRLLVQPAGCMRNRAGRAYGMSLGWLTTHTSSAGRACHQVSGTGISAAYHRQGAQALQLGGAAASQSFPPLQLAEAIRRFLEGLAACALFPSIDGQTVEHLPVVVSHGWPTN